MKSEPLFFCEICTVFFLQGNAISTAIHKENNEKLIKINPEKKMCTFWFNKTKASNKQTIGRKMTVKVKKEKKNEEN